MLHLIKMKKLWSGWFAVRGPCRRNAAGNSRRHFQKSAPNKDGNGLFRGEEEASVPAKMISLARCWRVDLRRQLRFWNTIRDTALRPDMIPMYLTEREEVLLSLLHRDFTDTSALCLLCFLWPKAINLHYIRPLLHAGTDQAEWLCISQAANSLASSWLFFLLPTVFLPNLGVLWCPIILFALKRTRGETRLSVYCSLQ